MTGRISSVNSVPIAMPLTSMMPMLLRASAPAPVTKTSGRVPEHRRGRRHQDRPQARHRGLADGVELLLPAPAARWRTRR